MEKYIGDENNFELDGENYESVEQENIKSKFACEICAFYNSHWKCGSAPHCLADYRKDKRTVYFKLVQGFCGKINDGKTCQMPKGSKCPDCGPCLIDFAGQD